jgi:tonB-linked outer membrane protein, susC/ragA family
MYAYERCIDKKKSHGAALQHHDFVECFQLINVSFVSQTNCILNFNLSKTRKDMNKPAKSYDFLWLIIKSSSIFLLLAVYNSLTIGAYAYSGTQAEMYIEVPGNSAATQQKKQITGTVTDERGEAIIGANVVEKGTINGSVTDVDGHFKLIVEDNAMLQISFIGFLPQEIKVAGKNSFKIVLKEDAGLLEEVVVVGYGSQSRRNVTGSVSKVNMSDMESRPNTNVTQALRGQVAGVQFTDNGRPGQNGSILVRGPRSLSGGNDPLIILDGIYFNGSMIDINPNDIESMEVLKDASSAAIYGSRAANGVILITSKKGKTEKPNINVSAFYGLSDWASKLKLLTPERYLEKSMEIRRLREIPYDPNDVSTYLTLTEAENYRNGHTIDPLDLISQQGQLLSVDASMSGKSKNTNYYISASMAQEKGLILDDNLTRMSFRVNLESKITDWLSIGTSTMFSQNDQSGVPASVNLAKRQSPYGTWYREDGSPTQYTVPEDQGVSANPVRSNSLSQKDYYRNNLFANFYSIVNIPWVKGLTYRINYSMNYRWIRDYNSTKNDVYVDANTSSASKRNWMSRDWVVENILDYKFQLGEKHAFDVTLMYGANRSNEESTTASADQLEFDTFGWNNLGVGGLQETTSSAKKVSGISSMARLNYRLMNKYLFTLTARRDGSSVFAANHKYATFPSAAFAWIVSEEDFLDNAAFLDLLKLRVSYGAVGNQAISPYQSLSLATTSRYVFGEESALGIYPSRIANTDLKWETTYTANIALDFELFNKRIGGTVELYNMDTRDLLVERSIPVMTGYSSIWTNLGEVNNKGIELTLNTVNIRNKDFEWSTSFVFSHNKNKIVSLYGEDANGDGKEDDDIGNSWFIGKPINVYYDYVFDGIYQEGDELPAGYASGYARFKDLNDDGKVEAEHDRTIIGQGSQPKYRWGITNNFSYKNFDLSIFINAMQGWIGTFNDLDFYNNSLDPVRPVNMYDGGWWTPENKSNSRPSLEYRRSVLGHNWYSDRSFIRVQEVSLSYRFPQKFLTKYRLSNLSVFLSGKNLLTFTDWLGTNPESISSERYPIARTYTLGFKLGF